MHKGNKTETDPLQWTTKILSLATHEMSRPDHLHLSSDAAVCVLGLSCSSCLHPRRTTTSTGSTAPSPSSTPSFQREFGSRDLSDTSTLLNSLPRIMQSLHSNSTHTGATIIRKSHFQFPAPVLPPTGMPTRALLPHSNGMEKHTQRHGSTALLNNVDCTRNASPSTFATKPPPHHFPPSQPQSLTQSSHPFPQGVAGLHRGWCPVGECLPGARPARYLCIKYPSLAPSLFSPWEVTQVDRTRPQNFRARHVA